MKVCCIEQSSCSPGRDIFLIGIQAHPGTMDPNTGISREAQGNAIVQGDALHQHRQVVIAIGSLAEHMQTKVDFSRGQIGFNHKWVPLETE